MPMTIKQFRQRLKKVCPMTYTKRMDLSPVWSKANPKRPK